MFKHLFYFDIETVGNFPYFEGLRAQNEREFKLFCKKYETIPTWKELPIEEVYLSKSGLHSTFGKIVCISFGWFNNNEEFRVNSFCSNNEIEIVSEFNNLLKKVETKGFALCGFNVLSFDVPWLIHKMNKYDIIPSNLINVYGKKPWEIKIIDLADEWKQKFSYYASLDEVVYELGLESPKNGIDGSQIHKVYWEERDLSRISKYCCADVNAVKEIAMKMFKN